MTKPKKNRTFERLIVAGAFVALSGVAAIAFPTIPAVGGNVADQAQHFATCFGLMITDPDEHVAECGIGDSRTIDTKPAYGGGGSPQLPEIITTTEIPDIITTTFDEIPCLSECFPQS